MTMTGPGLPVTKEQKTHWQKVYNGSGEKIPPFACMMRQPYTVASLAVDAEGCDVWGVDKPNLWAEGGQNGGHLIFNGPDPIEPERYGRGTLDYPTKALILASETPQAGEFLNGTSGTYYLDGSDIYIGPRSGSWLLWATPNPYWDDTYLPKPTPNAMVFRGYSQVPHGLGDKIKTCIVEPAPKSSPIIYMTQEEGFFSAPAGPFTSVGQNVCTGYWDDRTAGIGPDDDDLPLPKAVGVNYGDTENRIGITVAGLYQCVVSGTMWSDTTEQSALLAGVLVAKRLKKGSTSSYDYLETGLEFARYQTIDYDQYGVEKWRSKENVCSSQLMNLMPGDDLYLVNAATTNWYLAYAALSLYRIGNPGSFSTAFYSGGVM